MSRCLNAAGELIQPTELALADDAPLPVTGTALITAARLLAEAPGFDASRAAAVLPNTFDIKAHYERLKTCPLLVLEFPGFADGRAYSQASLLRRLGYPGLLRASGQAVVADQLLMLRRCGFDEFLLRDDVSLSAARAALGSASPAYYQASASA